MSEYNMLQIQITLSTIADLNVFYLILNCKELFGLGGSRVLFKFNMLQIDSQSNPLGQVTDGEMQDGCSIVSLHVVK